MTNVQFDEQGSEFKPAAIGGKKSALYNLVERLGVPTKYVPYVLLGLAVVCIIVAVPLFSSSRSSGSNTGAQVPPEILNAMKNR